MEQAQAQAEARRRYGPDAFAEPNPNGLLDIGIRDDPIPGISRLLGWGKTWEEALELAAERAAWHTLPKPKPRQLTLFEQEKPNEQAT